MARAMYIGSSSKKVTIKNVLPATNLTNYRCDVGSAVNDSTHTKYGDTAIKLSSNGLYEAYVTSRTTFPLIPTHIYYVRYEVYMESIPSGTWGYGCYFPIAEPAFFNGQFATSAGQWSIISGINNRSSFSNGNYAIRLDMDNYYIEETAWIDGAMLIDLTEAFGAGNEPTKEWCDANISYFEGEEVIEFPLENLVSRKVKKQYANISNVARAIKKGYTNVNNVARLFFSNMVTELNIYGAGDCQNNVNLEHEINSSTIKMVMTNDGTSTSGDYHSYDFGWLFLDGVKAGDVITIDTTWNISVLSSNAFSAISVVYRTASGDQQFYFSNSQNKVGNISVPVTFTASADGMIILTLQLSGEHYVVTSSITVNKIIMNGNEIFSI